MKPLTKLELFRLLLKAAGKWAVVIPMLVYALKNTEITNDIDKASKTVFNLLNKANEMRIQATGSAVKQGIIEGGGLGIIGDLAATQVANHVAAMANRNVGLLFQGSVFLVEAAILSPHGISVTMEHSNPDKKRGGRADILVSTPTWECLQEVKTTTGSAWKQTAWENGRKPHVMIATGLGPSEFAPGKVKQMDYAKQIPVSVDPVIAKKRNVLSFEDLLRNLLEEDKPVPVKKAVASA